MTASVIKLDSRSVNAIVRELASQSSSRVARTVYLGPQEQTVLDFGVDSRPRFEFFGIGGPASFLARVPGPTIFPSESLSSLVESLAYLECLRRILEFETECWLWKLAKDFTDRMEKHLVKSCGVSRVVRRVHWAGGQEEPGGWPRVLFDIEPWNERALRGAVSCCLTCSQS